MWRHRGSSASLHSKPADGSEGWKGSQAVVEVREEHLMWESGNYAAGKFLARRWGGDITSLHVSCSRPLHRTRVSPESCSGVESSHAKEVLAGESQAHVASKQGSDSPPLLAGFSRGPSSYWCSPLLTNPQEAFSGAASPCPLPGLLPSALLHLQRGFSP